MYIQTCVFLSQVSSALLSDLRTALQDLFSELWEQYRAAQFVVRQFANAKAAWAVECTELKSLISRVRTRNSLQRASINLMRGSHVITSTLFILGPVGTL